METGKLDSPIAKERAKGDIFLDIYCVKVWIQGLITDALILSHSRLGIWLELRRHQENDPFKQCMLFKC